MEAIKRVTTYLGVDARENLPRRRRHLTHPRTFSASICARGSGRGESTRECGKMLGARFRDSMIVEGKIILHHFIVRLYAQYTEDLESSIHKLSSVKLCQISAQFHPISFFFFLETNEKLPGGVNVVFLLRAFDGMNRFLLIPYGRVSAPLLPLEFRENIE